MVKIIHVGSDGSESVAIEVDDFTIEILYAGIAEMLRQAEESGGGPEVRASELPREARLRRERVLLRIRK
jgi:hypothetical protein